ncbi:hypothetical protein H7849_17585 [Alloacidobacterium dinghuense]|uniref:Ig-like domain-containing protein n=1 Tax=Alloacidobacterium dinghuense TaxID=2763107 RepID=A0A7G8BEE3_9BACT|nr:hypothetical protein [Alloacidobacterium dinghuense]QNI30913.1 hypothetical protein H7849_17585 [Alloacidobacterium dinghuense]
MKRVYRPIGIILFVLSLLSLAGQAKAAVVVSPSSVQVKPGAQVQFSATGATIVVWGLSGAGCSGISCGQIDSSGLYTAPAAAPNPPTVTVTATSILDGTMGTATVTIGSATTVAVSISPTSATLSVKGQQQFKATVTGSSNTAVNWTVSGIGCVSGSCGTITSAGLYTAPAIIPNPALASVTATSVADTTKSASATVVIEAASSISVAVSPTTAQVPAGGQQQFTATVSGTTNTAVTWSLTGCSGAACGSISNFGLYTAPATVPASPTVTVVATSAAAPSQSGSAHVTIVAASVLTISPSNPQVKPGAQIQFSATGPQSGVVLWSVTGNGCFGITCGQISSTGLYTAPTTAPSPNTVVVTATSLSNATIKGSTTVTISAPSSVSVSLTPTTAQVNVSAQQQFKATVTGSTNTAVTWSVTGLGCTGSTCGTISTAGLYTAPSTVPNPSFVTVTATSSADSTKSASATVIIMQQISVAVTPNPVQVAENASQQFTAKVTGAANTAVTWTLHGSGCSGSACGTITASGLYTAPASVPNPAQVTVTATSVADGITTGTATVTVIVPVIVTVSPTNAIVAVSTTQQFRSSVAGSSNTAVTWSVSGTGCSGSTCGTISTAGLYTAPASLPSPATVTVKATSQANTSASASATVTLVSTNNSKLDGQYAFFFTGFDSNGVYQAAGSFTANGQGRITTGTEDVNNVAAPATDLAITGTYTVSSDNRGTMTINSPLGAFTYKFALNLLGNKGRFVSFDQSGVRGSGVILKQDPTAFDPSVLANGYVMGLSGSDMGGARVGALGLMFPDGIGFIAGSTLDVNDGGSVSPTFASFNGIYTVDSTGRGTATLLIPGFGGGTVDFALYVVSANEFLMVSVDPIFQNGVIIGGPAVLQNGAPFTSSSFKGGSIFNLSGTNGSAPEDMVGRLQFDGTVNVGVTFDQNNGGNITVGGSMTGAYDLELNGRGTLNLNSPSTGPIIWYVYATGPNQGFVMDASTAAASVGQMDPVTIVPPFSNSDALGTYLLGSGEPIVQAVPLYSGESSFDGSSNVRGQGTLAGAEDISKSSALSPNQTLAGTYSVSAVSNNGRGSILLTSPSAATIALWVISPSEMVGLDVDATVTQPTILHFEQ